MNWQDSYDLSFTNADTSKQRGATRYWYAEKGSNVFSVMWRIYSKHIANDNWVDALAVGEQIDKIINYRRSIWSVKSLSLGDHEEGSQEHEHRD